MSGISLMAFQAYHSVTDRTWIYTKGELNAKQGSSMAYK